MESREFLKNAIFDEHEYIVEERPSFWSYLSDMYAFPELIELYVPPVGEQGALQDAENIHKYFDKALREL